MLRFLKVYMEVHDLGVLQKAGYVTFPGTLTAQLTPSVVATFPVGCCNIMNQLVG